MNIANPPLPPGFRFHPTDQELIIHYLKKKVSSSQTPTVSIIADIDLYKYNPWDLPGKALFGEGEGEWFFFSPRERKYPNGARPNRAAASGYWKATGTDKPILATSGSQCIGVKKALVFYKGRPPKGSKTEWVMHEYRLLDTTPTSQKLKGSMRLDDWVLCRVRQKSSIPFQIGEKQDDSPSSSHHSFENNPYMDNPVMRERNDILQDSDCQVLQNVMGSQEQGAGVCWNYNPCVLGPNKASKVDAIPQGGEGPQPPLVSSVQQILDSIKRIPSFGGFEEYLLLQPNKRLHIGGGSADEQSPTNSASMSSCFPEFML